MDNFTLIGQKLVRLRFFLAIYFYSLVYVFYEFFKRIQRTLLNRPLHGTTTNLNNDLTGYVCLINGAVAGSIGRVVIQKLLKQNCSLIITVHGDLKFAEQSKKNLIENELKDFDSSLYRFEYLDLTSFESIVKFIKKLNNESQKIHFFINNAGIALRDYRITEDGFESQLQVNHLGGCLLLIGLFPLIVKTAQLTNDKLKSKIVFTNSCAAKFVRLNLNQLNYANQELQANFSTHKTYPLTKLYQLMFNLRFFDQMIKKNNLTSLISFINIHPGIVDSGLYNSSIFKNKLSFVYKIMALFMKKPEEGAINVSTPILTTNNFFNSSECLYLEDLEISKMNRACYSEELKEKVFRNTISLLKPKIEQFNLPNQFNPLLN